MSPNGEILVLPEVSNYPLAMRATSPNNVITSDAHPGRTLDRRNRMLSPQRATQVNRNNLPTFIMPQETSSVG